MCDRSLAPLFAGLRALRSCPGLRSLQHRNHRARGLRVRVPPNGPSGFLPWPAAARSSPPELVTLYNPRPGVSAVRRSLRGDQSDWFSLARRSRDEAVRHRRPRRTQAAPDLPFASAPSDPACSIAQRLLFGAPLEPRRGHDALRARKGPRPLDPRAAKRLRHERLAFPPTVAREHTAVKRAKEILAARFREPLSLESLASESDSHVPPHAPLPPRDRRRRCSRGTRLRLYAALDALGRRSRPGPDVTVPRARLSPAQPFPETFRSRSASRRRRCGGRCGVVQQDPDIGARRVTSLSVERGITRCEPSHATLTIALRYWRARLPGLRPDSGATAGRDGRDESNRTDGRRRDGPAAGKRRRGRLKILEAITAREPKNVRAWSNLGVARQKPALRRGDRAYDTALGIDAGSTSSLYNLAGYALKGERTHAFE